jgi:hypothetical protein
MMGNLIEGLREIKQNHINLFSFWEELAPIMTFIFQLSLDTGNIPDDWRKANMVVLFKKGDRHNI